MDKQFRRVYMTVNIPSDCEDDPDRRLDLAILEAKERMKTWAIPANWHKVWDDGENIRVCRTSNIIKKETV